MITQSVMLSMFTEVIHMKYENPTCEIVLLERADCLSASDEVVDINPNDSPFVDYPNF